MMRLYFLVLTSLLAGGTGPACREDTTGIASLLSKGLYEKMFPHHHSLYTYEALVQAATGFPAFAGEGDPSTRKRELAAFFAHIAHETTNGGPGSVGGAYAWGLFYTEE